MYEDRPGFDHEDGSCKKCENGHAHRIKNHKTGKVFYGCSNYPKCNNTSLIRINTRTDFFIGPDEDDMAWAEAMLGHD